jgi:hypothetical protein
MRGILASACLFVAGIMTSDIDFIEPREAPYKDLDSIKWTGQVKSTGRNFTAYMASVEDASLFSIALPEGGC